MEGPLKEYERLLKMKSTNKKTIYFATKYERDIMEVRDLIGQKNTQNSRD